MESSGAFCRVYENELYVVLILLVLQLTGFRDTE